MTSSRFLNIYENFCVYCALPAVFLLQRFGSIFRLKKVSGNNDQIGKHTTVAVQPRSWGWCILGSSLVQEGKTVN
jgi:hypothetical protein